MGKFKVVIFDLDGTIADTIPLCLRAFRSSIEPLIHKSLSDEEIINTFGPSEEGTILRLAPDDYDQGIEDYLRYYELYHGDCPEPFDGIKELISALKEAGITTAMVTGKGKHSTTISLRNFDLDHHFNYIETGWIHGPRKAEGIANIINALGDVTKEEVLYIGDAVSDITACRSIGIPIASAAWADSTDPSVLEELNPGHTFPTVQALTDWLISQV